jgi:hypothetical protein
MKTFQLLFYFFALSGISLYGMEDKANRPMVLSPITIEHTLDGVLKKIKRTVWHATGLEKITLVPGPFQFSPKTTLADDDIHKIVATMQHQANITDKPCFIFQDPTTATPFTHPEFSPFYTITLNPKDFYHLPLLWRKQTLGHELSHHILHKTKGSSEKNIWQSYNQVFFHTKMFYLVAILFLAQREYLSLLPPIWLNALDVASITQHEELLCDKMSVELFGNSATEKKELAKAGAESIVQTNPILRLVDEVDNLAFPHTHPPLNERLRQFRHLQKKYSAIASNEQNKQKAKL